MIWKKYKLIPLIVIVNFMMGCSYKNPGVKGDAPIRADDAIYGNPGEIRDAVLKLLPLGSSRSELEKFSKDNFSTGPASSDFWFEDYEQYKKYLHNEKICYQILKRGTFPFSSGWTNVIFILDKKGNLLDVVVKRDVVST